MAAYSRPTMDFQLLEKYGIPVLPYSMCKTEDDSLSFAAKTGYPLALKLSSDKALHKTEKGAVALGIEDEKSLLSTFRRLRAIDPSPSARLVVQKMVQPNAELILGGRMDAQFGPMVLFGLGGIYVEIFKDKSLRACPVDLEEALLMIRELKSYPILSGFRGKKAANEAVLASLIVATSKLMAKEKPSELDINPLIWTDSGFAAADVRVIW